MTRERAQYLWDRRGMQWALPQAFRAKCDSPTKPIYDDGMTLAEWESVRDLWRTMPGWTCWMDAFFRVLHGEA